MSESNVLDLSWSELDRSPNRPEDPPGKAAGLHAAAACGDLALVRRWLEREPCDGLDAEGWTPLHLASAAGHVAVVHALLAVGAPVDRRSRHGCSGATALSCAVAGGHLSAVDRLLAAGADPNAADDAGYTPLLLAAERGDPAIVRSLLRAGADPGVELGDTGTGTMARRARSGAVLGLLKQRGVR